MTPPSSNAQKHDSRNPALRLVLGHFTRTLCRELATLRPRSVLDVGCGEGYMLAAIHASLPGVRLRGFDLSPHAIAAAKARLGDAARVEVADARTAADDERHDVVIMLEVLEHLDDPAPMLDVLARLCAPGGHVILSVPHEPWFRTLNLLRGHHVARLGNHPEHVQQFSRAGFLRFVERRFEIERAPWVPPWTMVVARPR